MPATFSVPGVYHEQRPRTPEAPRVRTDVAGFVGLEPRLREAIGPAGEVRVAIATFRLLVNGRPGLVRGHEFELAPSAEALLGAGQSIAFGVVATGQGELSIEAVPGAAAQSGLERAPDDGAIAAAVGTAPFARVADVVVRREGAAAFVTIVPSLRLTRCDDFRDYVLAFGEPPDDGLALGAAVRAFFANGGRRCWVATVRRPGVLDAAGLARARGEIVGLAGASEEEATGLERLLLVPEVTTVDAPDLYAVRPDGTKRSVQLPARVEDGCFVPCRAFLGPAGTATSPGGTAGPAPLFDAPDVLDTQRRMLTRAIPDRWRVLLLLAVPQHPDPSSGRHAPPTHAHAATWAAAFAGLADDHEMSGAALYWPWVLSQERVGDPVRALPPTPFAAGVIARRDLARGPQIAPANETLTQVVGLAAPVDDAAHGALYDPGPAGTPAVNVLRAFPGRGIQVWGSRTLSRDRWLRFLPVRRTLTAVELRMKAALDPVAFEPHSPALWLQVTQVAFGVLFPIFESGALRGARPEEAFYVRCDESVNPPEAVANGVLTVEIGVAIAAPMEFVVFRVGRREGIVEIVE